MSEELDDIGAETAAMMKTMLSLATLIALRTRERGQKEAEARVKITEARIKEAKELQIREARDAKAKDPRNAELARMVENAVSSPGISLDKDRFGPQAGADRMATAAAMPAAPQIRYDSPERRTAIAAHLARIGVAPELAAVRMLVEVGQGAPVEEAARTRSKEAPGGGLSREQELALGLERSR
ncbi:hypothetical protein [Nocardia arizonensis]|uniref:hypothetical protein n=1 Tax=Nocardia arizonensis TaxID=1141647 RepID=UPI0006D1FA32|nr:hypothetical protein [Nocardia arizonensis]